MVDTFQGQPSNAEQLNILNAHGGNIEKMFRANMAALKIDVTIHAKSSVEAAEEFAPGSIDAVFIDDDHREAHALASINAWKPRVKRGGIICGHDYDEAGVAAAVKAAFHGNVETIGRCWFVQL